MARRKLGSLSLSSKCYFGHKGSLSGIVGAVNSRVGVGARLSSVAVNPMPTSPPSDRGDLPVDCVGSNRNADDQFVLVSRYGKKPVTTWQLNAHDSSPGNKLWPIVVDIRIILRKKHANAVRRNLLRRRLKEAIRSAFRVPAPIPSGFAIRDVAIVGDTPHISPAPLANASSSVGAIILTEKPSYSLAYAEIAEFARVLRNYILRKLPVSTDNSGSKSRSGHAKAGQ